MRSLALVASFLCAVLSSALAFGQTAEARLRPLQVGDQTVSGFVLPEPANTAGYIVEVYDVSGGGHRFVDRRTIDRFERGGGFSVQLTAPLRANQRVEVSLNGTGLTSGTLDVTAPPPAPSVHLKAPHAGDMEVAGIISPVPKATAVLAVEVRASGGGFVATKTIERIDPATGAFAVTLPGALRSGNTVSVVGPVAANSSTVPAFNATVQLTPALFDGAKVVKGYVDGAAARGWVRVKVMRSALEKPGEAGGYLQMKRVAVDDLDNLGQFTASLDQPLVAGQVVVAEAFTAAGESSAESSRVTVTDPGDWGRARAYFSGGVVFSKGVNDFSKQDLALAFVLDKGWLQKPDYQLGAPIPANIATDIQDKQRAIKVCPRGAGHAACVDPLAQAIMAARAPYSSTGTLTFRQLNTFFDTRLTALPVAAPPATTAPTGTAANGAATTGTTSGSSQFIDSRKGAVIQIGAYAPFYGPQTSWVHQGAVNALFIAPLVRIGIQTIPGDASGAATVNANGDPDDVFHFWGIGFGVGHQKLSGTTDQTPEVISYLHVVWGHSEAFQYKKKPTDANVVNPRRTMVEGRLKIPSSPLQIGFDANLGDGHDDVRFVFGTRFDIGAMFSRLRGF